MKYCYYKCSC